MNEAEVLENVEAQPPSSALGNIPRCFFPYSSFYSIEGLERGLSFRFADVFRTALQSATNLVDVDYGVEEVTDFYWKHKDTISRNALWRIICVDLPLFCFQRKVDKADTVARVLRCIYDMEDFFGNCLGLFLLGVFPTPARCFSTIRRGEYRIRAFKYVSYFLNHINRMRLTFDDLRFSDLINLGSMDEEFVEIVLYTKPELVLLLARNGAWSYDDLPDCFSTEVLFCYHALQFLVKIGARLGQWSRENLQLKSPKSILHYDVMETCAVFTILAKCMSNPHALTLKALRISAQDPREPRPEDYGNFFDTVFPGSNFGQPIPAALKHTCRRVIRARLHEKWQLPDGVFSLGLPRRLSEYIHFST